MALARWQGTIVDSAGTTVASASVKVYSETTGALAVIYSDRAGLTSITNPTTADSEGFVGFYASGDAYRIVATSGATSRTFRYVGIGTSQEEDKPLVTIAESVFSGAGSFSIANLDLYRKVVYELDGITVGTDTDDLYALVSVDDGLTYITGTSNAFTLDRRAVATPALVGSAGTAALILTQSMGTVAGEAYQGVVTMRDHTNLGTYKYINSTGSVLDSGSVFRTANMNGLVVTGSAVTNLLIQASTGTISGKITVKGELL